MDNPSAADGRRGQTTEGLSNERKESDGCRSDKNCDVLVMRFMKNSIVDNPIIVSTFMCIKKSLAKRKRERERESES